MSNLRNRLPPLTSLAAFDAVSRLLSFTKAANELCLTQAAISRQIIALEKHLGASLFERRPHDVALTREGKQFASSVNPAINTIGDAAMKLKTRRTDELTIFSEPCITNYWLMPRISRYQLEFPNTKIKLVTSDDPLDEATDAFDIGLQYGEANKKVFVEQASWSDEIIVVASPLLEGEIPSKVVLNELLEHPFVHIDRIGPGWMSWNEFFSQHGFDFPENHTSLFCNNYLNAIDAAIQGAGLLLGWRFVVESAVDEGKLKQIGSFSVPSPDDQFMYTKRKSVNAKAAQNFITWIKA
jgi:DNA-binding transcriptional LysR family regulator